MNPKTIIITGGIGTGKSTATDIISKNSYTVIDADVISRKIVEKDGLGYNLLIEKFPNVFIDGELNREKLGKMIFSNEKKRGELDSILHPIIVSEIKKEIKKSDESFIFIDIPLYFETNLIKGDEVWLIYADEKTQLNRIRKRNGYSEKEAILRIKAQIDIEEKVKLADKIFDNTKDVFYLKKQIDRALRDLNR